MSVLSRLYLGLNLVIAAAFAGHMALADPATRIVSVGGSVTEIVYALDQQHRLIARDTTSVFPAEARQLPDIGYQRALAPEGVLSVAPDMTLLRDHDDSNAWTHWRQVAGLPQQARRDALIIPDPNVRVQAVIDGQGIALMDALIARELEEAKLFRLSEQALTDYGYFLVRPRQSRLQTSVKAFADWLQSQ